MAKNSLDGVVDQVGSLFDKFPALPKDARELLVKVAPWIALIFGALGVLGALAGFGVLTVFSPLAMMGGGAGAVGAGIITAVLWLLSSVLMLAAFPGTKNRKAQGWNFLFYSEAVSLAANVLSFTLSGLVFALIAFYLLFQIRSYYK